MPSYAAESRDDEACAQSNLGRTFEAVCDGRWYQTNGARINADLRNAFGCEELLGATLTERLHQSTSEHCKLPRAINGLFDAKWLNSSALEWIASESRKEVHVQVR